MWGRIAAHLTIWLLKGSQLRNEERQLLTSTLLDKLGALPLHATITIDESNRFFVAGRPMDLEVARALSEGSRGMLRNYARKFVRETVQFLAIKKGVHENTSPEQGLFAKAALWAMDEEDQLYRLLAQEEPDDE